jgi:hypothetical protein
MFLVGFYQRTSIEAPFDIACGFASISGCWLVREPDNTFYDGDFVKYIIPKTGIYT